MARSADQRSKRRGATPQLGLALLPNVSDDSWIVVSSRLLHRSVPGLCCCAGPTSTAGPLVLVSYYASIVSQCSTAAREA